MKRNMQYEKACVDPVGTGGLCWLRCDGHRALVTAEVMEREF